MFYYSGTDVPIKVNDIVTWHCDIEAKGQIVVLEYSYFSVYWKDIKLKFIR